jgi:hypothetical protein
MKMRKTNLKNNSGISVWDTEVNPLSRTLKLTVTLDESAIHLLRNTMREPIGTPQELGAQVCELLERSLYLNLPRPISKGPGDKDSDDE